MEPTKIVLFKHKQIRRVLQNGEWWFSVVDIIQVLTNSTEYNVSRKYWNKLSQRLREEGSEVVTFCHRLKLLSPDGKMRETDCAVTEGIFRIIQSIPSPRAEPLKRWLASIGGSIAGEARLKIEKKLARPIISGQNYKKLNK